MRLCHTGGLARPTLLRHDASNFCTRRATYATPSDRPAIRLGLHVCCLLRWLADTFRSRGVMIFFCVFPSRRYCRSAVPTKANLGPFSRSRVELERLVDMFWRAASSTPRRLASMHGTTYLRRCRTCSTVWASGSCGWARLFWRRETRAMRVQNLTKAETCQVQSNRHPGTAEGFQSIFMHLRAEPAGMDLATLAAGRYAMEQTRMFSPLNRVPSLRGK